MNLYERHCLPCLINIACNSPQFRHQREQLLPQARGRVLEVGMGTGLNLPYYDRSLVDFVWGLEPNEGMRSRAARNIKKSALEVKWLGLPGEEIPLDDHSVDTVVLTYTLCTIPDWRQALGQMRRVLKTDSQLLFSEHGQAPDAAIRKWQNRLNPIWRPLAGGCNLNRPIPKLIEQCGFNANLHSADYLDKAPRTLAFNYRGTATPR